MRHNSHSRLLVACTVLALASGCGPRRGDRVLETWETTNQSLKVRIKKFDERQSVLLPHTYFALEAAAVGSDEWHEVMSWRSDDPIPIPSQQVKVLNNQVVYAFANPTYVATTDAGHTWSTWDLAKDGPRLPYPKQAWVKEVHVSSDGNGRMILNYRSNVGFALAELTTTDYGVHWATK